MMRIPFIFVVCLGVVWTPQHVFSKEIKPTELPKRVIELYKADKNCFNLGKDELPQAIETDQLSEDVRMFLIPCSVGAYNIFSKLYLLSEGEVEQEFFADFDQRNGWSGSDIIVNPGYDAKTKTLHSFNKSAGHGWCGSSGTWRWNKYAFQMTRFQSWDDCTTDKAPEDWPYVYQKK